MLVSVTVALLEWLSNHYSYDPMPTKTDTVLKVGAGPAHGGPR